MNMVVEVSRPEGKTRSTYRVNGAEVSRAEAIAAVSSRWQEDRAHERKVVTDLWRQGLTGVEITRVTGVPTGTVFEHAKAEGLRKHAKPMPKAEQEALNRDIAEWHRAGWTIKEMAEVSGADPRWITVTASRLRSAGEDLPKHSDRAAIRRGA
jgi:hypothetical protein